MSDASWTAREHKTPESNKSVKGYLPAILGHFGCWVHPARRQEKGPWPKPRWGPLPGLLYAQVIKEYRRRRLVGVTHRVVEDVSEVLVCYALWVYESLSTFHPHRVTS
jgi:hypothetical protein